MSQSRVFAVILSGIACASTVHASLIFDQSPPNGNSGEITTFRLADDFTLAGSSSIDAVNFWYQAQFQTDLTNVTYAFYANTGGQLGSLLYTGTVAPATSFDAANFSFFASFALPNLAFSVGTYWLELHAGASLTDDNGGIAVWWTAANDNATNIALLSSSPNLPNTPVNLSGFNQYAFQLDGTGSSPPGVPEPSTLLLTAAGAAIFARRRARSQKTKTWRRNTTNEDL